MSKILATCAALAVTALIALPAPAGADERRADGVRNSNFEQWEFSDQRRRYRTRYYAHRRYYAPRRYYRSYYRPYYRPYYQRRPGLYFRF